MESAMSSLTFSHQSPLPTSHKSWFDSQQKKVWFCLSWLLAMLIVASVVSLSFGPAGWDIRLSVAWFLPDTWHSISTLQLNIISEIRLPRLCLGLLIGAVLAQTGAATQALCRNPLADPSVIGVSSGAAVMAVGMIALGPLLQATFGIKAELMLPYAAFIGALLATLLVYQFAQSEQGVQVTSLILVGVAMNALGFALIGLLSFYADDSSLRLINYWTMGSLAGANWSSLCQALPLLLLSLIGLWSKRQQMSLLLLGESEAKYMGVNIKSLKNQIVVFVAIGVGAAVALTGLVGFLGLVIPHLSRILVGANLKYMMPVSMLLGALVLLASDWIARVAVVPAELPIGIVTAIIGAPVFIWMLRRQLMPHG
jgi:iron complex transport system permease protein